MDIEGRKKFDVFYRDLLLGKVKEYPIPEEITKVEIIFPQENATFDYYYEASLWLVDERGSLNVFVSLWELKHYFDLFVCKQYIKKKVFF